MELSALQLFDCSRRPHHAASPHEVTNGMILRSRVRARLLALWSFQTQKHGLRALSSAEGNDVIGDDVKKSTFNKQLDPELPTHTFRTRAHGNRQLPLSTFLDPFRIEQRHRHRNRTPKPAPPNYKDLDSFRQKLACNPYARMLAQPVRPCVLSGASLPRSMLVNFRELIDPEPPHAKTLAPVTLYNKSTQGLKDESAESGRRLSGTADSGRSISLNKRLVQWLADVCEATGTLKGALHRYDGKMPPNTVATITELLAEIVTRGLRWPLQRGSKDFVTLPTGLSDVAAFCEDPAVILFFGGRVYGKRVAQIEARVDEIVQEVDSLVHRAQIAFRTHSSAPALVGAVRRANPRLLHPPQEIRTIKCVSADEDRLPKHSIPVIPMVDLLGEEGVIKLLEGTKYTNTDFVAVRSSQPTVHQVALLLSCALWLKDGLVQKTMLTRRD